MSGFNLVFDRISRVAVLAFLATILATLVWASSAQAQALTPADDQYGNPTASLSGTAQSSGLPDGGGSSDDFSQADSSQAEGSQAEGVLPSTGGPILLAYAGVLLASGAGVVLLRRRSS